MNSVESDARGQEQFPKQVADKSINDPTIPISREQSVKRVHSSRNLNNVSINAEDGKQGKSSDIGEGSVNGPNLKDNSSTDFIGPINNEVAPEYEEIMQNVNREEHLIGINSEVGLNPLENEPNNNVLAQSFIRPNLEGNSQ